METPVTTIFKQQFGFTHGSVIVNTEDITDEESIVSLPGDANCINWVVGHIIDAQNQLLKLLKQQPVWDNEEFHCYARGANPKHVHELFLPFGKLKEYFKISYERLMAGINNVQPHELIAISIISLPDGTTVSHTLLEWLTVFSFHESYHCGQTGLQRRLLGKEGKIK